MGRRRRVRSSTVTFAGVIVAVACFGVGFVASYDDGGEVEVVAPPTPSTTSAPSTTMAPPDTSTPTTEPPPTTAATTVPSTVPATSTTPVPTSALPAPTTLTVPTVPTTVAPTVPPTTASPGRLQATYPRDSQGRMLLLAGGAAAVILQNVGGSPATFTVSGAGAITVGATGTATGLLAPGEVRSVPVVASRNPPPGPGPHGTITVLGAQGLVVAIPVVIT